MKMRKLFRSCLLSLIAGAFLVITGVRAQEMVQVPLRIVSYADMIVYNGKVVTMDDRTQNPVPGTVGQAMAIRDGRILAVGNDTEILLYAGPKTKRIDLKGRMVMPGIIDAHNHIHNGAVSLYARTHPEIMESVAKQFNVTGESDEELRRGIELVLKEKMAHPSMDQIAWINLPNGGNTGTGPGVKFLQDSKLKIAELDKMAPNFPVLLLSHPSYMTNAMGKKYIADLYGSDPEYSFELDENNFGNLIEYSRSIIVDKYFADKIPVLAEIIRGE
ncbi:MAG: amidohydrolase family protein, partial [Acidobacteria bacterium]|nr:amidohydrolase family protein [Acidobacteriota bacterium]